MGKYDWGKTGAGALAGGAQGFAMGGPVGGALGALAGGLTGLFGSKKKKKKKLSSFDKRQKDLNKAQHESIFGQGPLADLYNYDPAQANSVFDQTVANPEYRNFAENIVPQITGSFRSQGLQNSTYAADALAKRGRDVQESLAAQRSKFMYDTQNQARQNKINAVENLQNRDTFKYEGTPTQPNQSSGFNFGSLLNQNSLDKFQDMLVNYLPGGV